MISHHNLKEWLLKAVNLSKRDRSHLIQVERTVIKPGMLPFRQRFLVRPDQVKKTDVIISGHHNLLDGHPNKPTVVVPLTSTKPTPPAVKAQTEAFFNTFTDRQQFYDTLIKNGISWKDPPPNPNVSPKALEGMKLMRAKMALNASIQNGLDITKLTPLTGFDSSIPGATVTPISQPVSTQSGSPIPVTQPPVQPQQTTWKGNKFPQWAKDLTKAYADSFATRQDFYDRLNQLGITWTQPKPNPNVSDKVIEGTNYMYAKMAVTRAILTRGFHTETETFNDGTPTNVQPVSAQPVLDDDAQPDNTVDVQPEPPKDPSLLDIPDDATEEQKEIIKHINNMTNVDNIRRCSVLRLVPEDTVAENYLSLVSFSEMIKSYKKSPGDYGAMPEAVRAKFKADLKLHIPDYETSLDITDSGLSKSPIISSTLANNVLDSAKVFPHLATRADAINTLLQLMSNIGMHSIVNPMGSISVDSSGRKMQGTGRSWGTIAKETKVNADELINILNSSFSDYTTDKYKGQSPPYLSNLGYMGFSPSEYEEQYDLEKEGFIRYLRKIQQRGQNDVEINARVEHMIENYDKIMQKVKGNRILLTGILQAQKYKISDDEINGLRNSSTRLQPEAEYFQSPHSAQVVKNLIDVRVKAVVDALTSNGNSYEDAMEALEHNIKTYTSTLTGVWVKDSSTGDWSKIDVISNAKDENGNKLFSDNDPISFPFENYALLLWEKTREHYNMPADVNSTEANDWLKGTSYYGSMAKRSMAMYQSIEQEANLTQDDFNEIKGLAADMFGVHLNTQSMKDNPDTKLADIDRVTDVPTNADNFVYSNILLGGEMSQANLHLEDNVNYKNQKYTYIATPKFEIAPHYKRNNAFINQRSVSSYDLGYGYHFQSAQEVSDKITQQLDKSLMYGIEEFNNVQEYFSLKAKEPSNILTESELAFNDTMSGESVFESAEHTPIKDLLYKVVTNMAEYSPSIQNLKNPKQTLAKRLKYTPLDYDTELQNIRNANLNGLQNNAPESGSAEELKTARQHLYNNAVCTIMTEDKVVSDNMMKEIITTRFDYKDGEKTPDGATAKSNTHKGRLILFNSPIFRIRNTTLWEKRYNEEKARLKAIPNLNSECYKELDLVHGCPRWCMASIVGRSQGWFMGQELENSGKMLGAGAYFGYKFGKSTVYAGDNSYSNIHYYSDGIPEGWADGVMLMCNVMRGENYATGGPTKTSNSQNIGTSSDMKLTSLSMDMGVKDLNDFEMAVKRNELILPHHFVDVSCRYKYKNVAQDHKGNYYEWNEDYEKYSDAMRSYNRLAATNVNPPKKPDPWTGAGYTPKWDKDGHRIDPFPPVS